MGLLDKFKKDKSSPKDIWDNFFKACLKQQWKEALELLDALKNVDAHNPQVFMKQGDVLQRTGNTKGSINAYNHAALLMRNAGFSQKALAVYKIVLRMDPKDPDALAASSAIIKEAEAQKSALEAAMAAPAAATGAEGEPAPGSGDFGAGIELASIELASLESLSESDGESAPEEQAPEPAAIETPEPSAGSSWDAESIPVETAASASSFDKPSMSTEPAAEAASSWDEQSLPIETASDASSSWDEQPAAQGAETPSDASSWEGQSLEVESTSAEASSWDEQPAAQTEQPAAGFNAGGFDSGETPGGEGMGGMDFSLHGEGGEAEQQGAWDSQDGSQSSGGETQLSDFFSSAMDEPKAPAPAPAPKPEPPKPKPAPAAPPAPPKPKPAPAPAAPPAPPKPKPAPAPAAPPGKMPEIVARMNVESRNAIRQRGITRKFADSQVIVSEEASGQSMYIILTGKAKVVTNLFGKHMELATLHAGDFFGEIAFLTGRPRTASVIAIGEADVMEISRELMQEVIDKNPPVFESLMEFYRARAASTIKKVKGG